MLSDMVRHNKSAKIIESLLSKKIKAGINDKKKELFYSSDITKCDRRIIYKAIGTPHEVDLKIKNHEDCIVNKWIELLNSLKEIEVVDAGTNLNDHNYNLTAEAHAIINIDGAVAVVMVKEVSNDLFQKGATSRNHVVDLMSQMWMAEVNEGFLVYENIQDRQFKIFHVAPHIPILNAVKDKFSVLHKKKLLGILPDRKYEEIDAHECQSCEFKDICWA